MKPLTEQERTLREVGKAAKRRAKAEADRKKATDELREFCEAARFSGVSITRIASQAGLSRQGVYDLLAERRAP